MRLHHFGSIMGACMIMGCSSADPEALGPSGDKGDDLLNPPPAGQGIQLKMVSTIAPGLEIERCKFFQVPAEGLNVNSAIVRYVAGSHHVLLYRTSHMSIPTVTRSGKAVNADENGVFDCADGAPADWDVTGVIAGAQSATAKNAAIFPPGVAAKIAPGTVLVINTHYLNTQPTPVVTDVRLNLFTLPDKDLKDEGGFLFFYNPFIRVPARGAASSRMRCTVPNDLTLVSGQSHMHRRGVGYVANLVEPDNATMAPIYTSHDWENVPISEWTPGMALRKGQSIDYTCDYQNTENRQIAQGATTKDEMCMFLGTYYPRNQAFESCGISTAGNGATFIGTGTADGKTTIQCIAQYGASDETQGELYGCVQDSCPAIAEQLTGHLKCQIEETSAKGRCGAACSGTDGDACNTCMTEACGAARSALAAATCN